METAGEIRDEAQERARTEPPRPTAARPRLVRLLGVCTGLAAVLLVAVSAVHVVMVFFHVAPRNTVSERYEEQIDGWVYPFFEQDWRLFAPNPASANVRISARTRQVAEDGTTRESGWVDLTARDTSAVTHNVFPSHTAQNTMRRAWSAYVDTHGSDDESRSERAWMMQQYLRNIAVSRLAGHGPDEYDAIQLRVETVPIGAGGARPVSANAVETRELPWWEVSRNGN